MWSRCGDQPAARQAKERLSFRSTVDALGLVAVDVPVADLTGRGSGAVGSLLCNLGSLLNGPLGAVTRGVQGLVNAVNRVI